MDNIVKLRESIWQISIPYYNQFVNVFLIEDEKITLIDSGPPYKKARRLLLDSIKWIGYDWSEIDQIILTHHHIDHVGGLFFLDSDNLKVGFNGITTLISDYDKYLELHKDISIKLVDRYPEYEEQLISDTAIKSLNEMFPVNGSNIENICETVAGESIYLGQRSLRVVHTPGHSQVHMCLYEENENMLFSGDFMLQRGPGLVELFGDSIFEFQQSVKTVENLELGVIYPSHGSAMDPATAINHITRYIENQEKKILRALQDGDKTISEILTSYYGYSVNFRQFPFLLGGLDTFIQHLIRNGKIQKNGKYIRRLI